MSEGSSSGGEVSRMMVTRGQKTALEGKLTLAITLQRLKKFQSLINAKMFGRARQASHVSMELT
jgi:hypothetical protein